MHPRAVAHDDTPRSLRGEGLIAHTTVRPALCPPSRGGLRQQPARPVFRSETDLQLDNIGIAATNVTAHNVVIQFDNTGTT